jgi:hypothetical protein
VSSATKQGGGGGERKKKKKNLFLTNKMSILCPLLHTKQKNLSLQQRTPQKKKSKPDNGCWIFFSLAHEVCVISKPTDKLWTMIKDPTNRLLAKD